MQLSITDILFFIFLAIMQTWSLVFHFETIWDKLKKCTPHMEQPIYLFDIVVPLL